MANKPIKVAAPKMPLASKKSIPVTPKALTAKNPVSLRTGSGRRIVN